MQKLLVEIQHYTNSMYLYCRLVERRVKKDNAIKVCVFYDKIISAPVRFITDSIYNLIN